ncbi:AI-2E family transporter [Actimicrobium antarcticum]|uniref:AI-2E family transporter n=1 Tax=Actimicrobium antarcticum TaxID=1051899 RepID=A0ABP7SST2_9BURK
MFGFDVRIARIVWTALLVAFFLFIVYALRSTLLVVVFAIFFSYLLYPLVELVERIKPARMPRTVSIGIVFVVAVLLFGMAGLLFGSTITDEAVRLSQQLPTLLDPANISARLPLPEFLKPQRAKILGFLTEQLQNGTGQALPFAQRLGMEVMHVATNLIYLILIPVLSFLLIKEAPLMRAEFLNALGTARESLWSGITEDLDGLLSKYVRALLLLSMATFVIYSLVFSALGVPYALLLSGIAGLLEFIPFVGPLSAVVVVLAVAAFSGFPHLLWVLVFILAYRMFQDYVLNPYLMSEGVEVSPLLIIVGLLAGDELAGVVGIFLSVPVLAALKIIFVRLRARARVVQSPPDRNPHVAN